MTTEENKNTMLALCDEIVREQQQLREMIFALPVEIPEEPPPTGPLKVTGMVVTPVANGLKVDWTNPVGLQGVLISWGAGTWLGSSTDVFEPYMTTFTISNLTPGVTYTVDVLVKQNGSFPTESKVTVTGVPLAGGGGTPGTFPTSGTRAEKEAYIKSVAGPTGDLVTVTSANAAQYGLSVSGSIATLNSPRRLENLKFDGEFRLASGAGHVVEIVNCDFKGLWSSGGHAKLVDKCRITHRPHNLGQGGLNGLANDFIVRRCDLSGFADGIQFKGKALIQDTWFHDSAYSSTTHNDDVQGYPGSQARIERCLMSHVPPYPNVRNGLIFTDGESPLGADVVDSVLSVTGAHRNTNWVANAYRGPFRFLRCIVDGKTVDSGSRDYKCTFTQSEVIP